MATSAESQGQSVVFSRVGGVGVALAVLVWSGAIASAAPPGAAPGPAITAPSATTSPGRPTRGPAPPAATSTADGNTQPPPPSVSQDAAARTRMHECGHQWSTMKKAGNVGTLTWKEFSASCLVVSR